VKAKQNQSASFIDVYGNEHFTLTFEVDGLDQLKQLHDSLLQKGVSVSEIEDRGHPGNNFVFYDQDHNAFDVWSVLSPDYKERYGI